MSLDDDYVRILDQGLRDTRAKRDEIAKETKARDPDSYYKIFAVFQPFTRAYVKVASVANDIDRQSFLLWGMKVFFIEAYDVHELATRGLYFATRRELRYILEFSKRAAKLDHDMPGRLLLEKLEEYDRRSDDGDFRGGQLLTALRADLNLSDSEVEAIRDAFGELSSDSHGSAEEVSKVRPERSLVPTYRADMMREAVKLASHVCDIYLVLMARGGVLRKDSVTFRPNEQQFFPLTTKALGA